MSKIIQIIQFDQVWSTLDRSDPKKYHFVNVTNFYSNIFGLVRNPLWSSLIHFVQIWSKKIKNNNFLIGQKYNLIKFDPFWTDLIHFDKKNKILTDLIKSDQKINKIENLIIYLNDYFIRNQIWSSLIHFGQIWSILIKKNKIWKSDDIFQWLFDQKSNLIKFDPFWSILTDVIKSDQKINKVENLMIYLDDYFIRNQIWSSLIHFDPFWTD